MAVDEVCEPWEIDFTCCDCWLPDDTTVPDPDPDGIAAQLAAQVRAVRWASNFLWKRSGRKVGVCESTVRICPPSCYCSPCTCGPHGLLTISTAPIVSIESITELCGNTVIAEDRYTVIDGHSIGLVDNTCGWQVGMGCELEIVLTAGWEPDVEAIQAASELACEYLRYCTGRKCRSEQFMSLAAGHHQLGKRHVILTGIPLVDHWLIEMNSNSPAGMFDPSEAMAYVASSMLSGS
jgi:hypothetical protein